MGLPFSLWALNKAGTIAKARYQSALITPCRRCLLTSDTRMACKPQDLPDGNYHALKKKGGKAKGKAHKEFMAALLCARQPCCSLFTAHVTSRKLRSFPLD